MARVALLSLPFHELKAPSLALSLLKADLVREGVPCSVRYLTLEFAARIGVDCYEWVSDDTDGTFVGEWIFAHCLSPEVEARAEQYVEEILIPTRRLTTSRREDLLGARDQARSFLEETVSKTEWSQFDIIGFTSTFQQNTASLALARMLKTAHPRTTIVFGGGNCEGEMGVQLHRSFPWVDYVCLGEGDGVFSQLVLQLLGRQPARALAGIVGPSERSQSLPAIPALPASDLDALPIPDFDDYFDQLGASPVRASVRPRLELETSRGCWWGAKHHCTFCGLNGLAMGFRSKTQARALSEIRSVAARYVDRLGPAPFISFTDNILDLSYFNDLLPALKASCLNVAFFYETKANLTRAQVKLLAEAGVRHIQPGIESLSTSILRLMRKGCTALQNVQLLKWCLEFGVRTSWNILYGFPGENPEEFELQIGVVERISHLQPPMAISPLRLDRFSPYFVQAKEYGLKNVRPQKPARYIFSMPEEDLSRLSYHFDFDYPDGRIPWSYAEKLVEAVERWQKGPRKDFLYMLPWGDRLLVWDGRGKRSGSYAILKGERKALYEFCDSVRSFKAISTYMTSTFGLSAQETRRLLEEFVAATLMLADDDHYLALAVGLHDRSVSGEAPAPSRSQAGEAVLGSSLRRPIRKIASLQWVDLDGGTLVLDPAARRVCRLNFTAAAIWDLLDDLHHVDAIVRTVSATGLGSRKQIRADTLATVQEFLWNGLIEIG